MENFSKDGKFDVLPIECTLLFWVICYSHRVLVLYTPVCIKRTFLDF